MAQWEGRPRAEKGPRPPARPSTLFDRFEGEAFHFAEFEEQLILTDGEQSLLFADGDLAPANLARLFAKPGMVAVEFATPIHAENLKVCAAAANLRGISVRGAKFPAESWAALAASKSLEELQIESFAFGEIELAAIARVLPLKVLAYSPAHVSDAALESFRRYRPDVVLVALCE